MTESPEAAPRARAGDLADELVATVESKVAELERSTANGFHLPGIYGGHPVLDDTTADLMYVLGLLVECGVDEVADIDLREAIARLIVELDPARVEAFSSYRVGETVLRLGGLDAVDPGWHDHVLEAVDSPQTIQVLDEGGDIPPNYAVVAARVLMTKARLVGGGTASHQAQLDRYLDRTRALLETQQNGWINDGMGAWVHYDIYTPDMYLFAEPLIDELGDLWSDGFGKVVGDLDAMADPGGAVVWGRSIGALGLAITVELAAAACGRSIGGTELQGRWLGRAAQALADLRVWFPNGVVAAHQNRAPMFYRGPARRLQMTLDLYGKLLLAALELRRRPDVEAASAATLWATTDQLFSFTHDLNAALWTHRSPDLSFRLPVMCGFSAEYLPSPRSPGLFEQPTSGHPTMVPTVHMVAFSDEVDAPIGPYVPAGLPTALSHSDGVLTLHHQRWAPVGDLSTGNHHLGGGRRATYTVDGRSLVVREQLQFDNARLPGPLSISIPETPERPLDVTVRGAAHRLSTVDTSGLAEWRSFWGPLPRVHQIEIEPARELDLTWTVTPRLRVASTIYGHPYDQSLYGPIADRLVAGPAGMPDPDLARRLRSVDVLHMAWPEWWSGTDPVRTAEIIEIIKGAGTHIVWTQHNLMPHLVRTPEAAASYQCWAQAVDAVIHHTEAGMATALATYDYGTGTQHVVIPHGHWGHRYHQMRTLTRAQVESEEAWSPCELRLAVVGAPRAEKHLQLVVDAITATGRDDIQLLIRADLDVDIPDDPRIKAEYGHLEEHRFHRRLAAYDALILPFAPEGMLTTGTAFDCIGAGVPAITSQWAFFDEVFDGADIRYGTTSADLTTCIDAITAERLAKARKDTEALQTRYDWDSIAQTTLGVLEAVADRRAPTRR